MGIEFYENGIADEFLVNLHPREAQKDEGFEEFEKICHALASRYGGKVFFVYSADLRMFAVRMDEAGARALADDPIVRWVEQNRPIVDSEDFDADLRAPAEEEDIDFSLAAGGVPWGLDRIDQPKLPLNGAYNPPNDGGGVRVYVIDSGINNPDGIFSNRLLPGVSFFPKGQSGTSDCANHGTGVAAVIGAERFGVARGVMIVPVRVRCRVGGTIDSMIAGVDWVRMNAIKPAVANISIAVERSNCLDQAVTSLIGSRVTCVAAAGNSGRDVKNFSPARVASAITVAASTPGDNIGKDSNFGRLVDLFAPGQRIHTVSSNGVSSDRFKGTSLAAGFVSGAAAMFLKTRPNASPGQVANGLVGAASQGVIQHPNGSPNLLLNI